MHPCFFQKIHPEILMKVLVSHHITNGARLDSEAAPSCTALNELGLEGAYAYLRFLEGTSTAHYVTRRRWEHKHHKFSFKFLGRC